MIKGVIFDMDGVMVENRAAHEESFGLWCDRNGIAHVDSLMAKYSGKGNKEIFEDVLGRVLSPAEVEKCSQEKEAIYREIYGPVMEPMPGLVELLKELKANGIKTSVGSSAILENVDFVLDGLGIRGYFDAISYSGLVERAKPAPDIFLLGAELLGLKPAECFVFEDAHAGVAAARSAGMRVGVLATTFPRSEHHDYDLLVDDFTQVRLGDIQ